MLAFHVPNSSQVSKKRKTIQSLLESGDADHHISGMVWGFQLRLISCSLVPGKKKTKASNLQNFYLLYGLPRLNQSLTKREQGKLPQCLGGKRAANRRRCYMKPCGLELRQVLSPWGTRGTHAVGLLRGSQAAKQTHLEKLPAMLKKVYFLDVELARSQECSPSNMDTAGKTMK